MIPKPVTPENAPVKLSAAVNRLIDDIQLASKSFTEDEPQIAVNNFLEVWLDFTEKVIFNPHHLQDVQTMYWEDYLALCEELQGHLENTSIHSRAAVMHSFINNFHMLLSRHLQFVLHTILKEKSKSNENERELQLMSFHFAAAFAFASSHSPSAQF
jgi:hypothetical protein